eukprot:12475608-Ditylum_brightwellii.AAC.1
MWSILENDSNIPLDEIWQSDNQSEHFKDQVNAENQHEAYSTKNVHSTHVEHGNNLEPSEKGSIYDSHVGIPSITGTESTTAKVGIFKIQRMHVSK